MYPGDQMTLRITRVDILQENTQNPVGCLLTFEEKVVFCNARGSCIICLKVVNKSIKISGDAIPYSSSSEIG